jgi:hypothetical protein
MGLRGLPRSMTRGLCRLPCRSSAPCASSRQRAHLPCCIVCADRACCACAQASCGHTPALPNHPRARARPFRPPVLPSPAANRRPRPGDRDVRNRHRPDRRESSAMRDGRSCLHARVRAAPTQRLTCPRASLQCRALRCSTAFRRPARPWATGLRRCGWPGGKGAAQESLARANGLGTARRPVVAGDIAMRRASVG